jgi:protein-L-isoaspartate(D-aspartate) O-methyltransferase
MTLGPFTRIVEEAAFCAPAESNRVQSAGDIINLLRSSDGCDRPMPASKRASLGEIRKFYAKLMASAGGADDPRLERAFELVPREAFLPPGPWHLCVNGRYFETPSADPGYLYQNALVAIDASRGINNGEPLLHAAWLGAVKPQSGETVCHIGAGTGYYTALLSMLVLPGGRVEAFEIDENLAARARDNLRPFDNVTVTLGDATVLPLPACDVVYVNAAVSAPPPSWLKALLAGGRMIFPWRPAKHIGIAVQVTCTDGGFKAIPAMPSWFIPCAGASSLVGCKRKPSTDEAWTLRSIWLHADREPDDTAVAIYEHVWFSSAPAAAAA